jgi:Ca2+-dependent lipid-binding protein
MKVDMYISGRKLKDLDVFSKSDPICILSEYNDKTKQWVKLGQTEQIKNNLNPDFKTHLTVNYFFEKKQNIKFEMIDWDGEGSYDPIGAIETTMGAVMGAKGQVFTSNLAHGKDTTKRGQIIVRAEAVQESKLTA